MSGDLNRGFDRSSLTIAEDDLSDARVVALISEHLGRGVATAILLHLMDESRKRSYVRLSLETGSGQAFTPAHLLYLKFGFEFCEPFADYRKCPFSRFMTLEMTK